MASKIIIGGGGTGGHIFPAIAIARALRDMDSSVDILFVGALGRIEMEKVPEAGFRIIGLPVSGFQRKLSIKTFTFFYKLLVSMIKARRDGLHLEGLRISNFLYNQDTPLLLMLFFFK